MTSTVTRRAGLVATALLCATAAACGPGTDDPTVHPAGPATGDSSATASGPTTFTAPPQASSSGGVAGSPAAAPAVRQCRVGDLALAPILPNGAAGHVGYDVVVTNTSGSRCRLPAGHPRYVATDAATGRTGTLPTTPATGAPATTVTIDPGARARSALLMIKDTVGTTPTTRPAPIRSCTTASACGWPAERYNCPAWSSM
jgi:hypothetical protein